MVVRSALGVLGIDIASVLRTTGDYVCVSDGVCTCRDIAGPVYLHQVGCVSRALLEDPEALRCREVTFAVVPQEVLILAFLRYVHRPMDSLGDELCMQPSGVNGPTDVHCI